VLFQAMGKHKQNLFMSQFWNKEEIKRIETAE